MKNKREINLNAINVLFDSRAAYRNAYKSEANGSTPNSYGFEVYCSSIVLMSSLLQAFIELEFEICMKLRFNHFDKNDIDKFWNVIGRNGQWGNPNPDNIDKLFMRLGISSVLKDYTWDSNPEKDRSELKVFNEIRNKIAHGEISSSYFIGKTNYKLSQGAMGEWKKFIESFANNFGDQLQKRLSHK